MKNGLKSKPKIFYVKDTTNIILKSSKNKIYKGEKAEFTVEIGIEKYSGKIDLYLIKNNEWT